MNKVVSTVVGVAGLVVTLGGAVSWGDTKPTINDLSDTNGNTAGGSNALQKNTTGSGNTAFGLNALLNNTTGLNNSAFGLHALFSTTDGGANNAIGYQALSHNSTGYDN